MQSPSCHPRSRPDQQIVKGAEGPFANARSGGSPVRCVQNLSTLRGPRRPHDVQEERSNQGTSVFEPQQTQRAAVWSRAVVLNRRAHTQVVPEIGSEDSDALKRGNVVLAEHFRKIQTAGLSHVHHEDANWPVCAGERRRASRTAVVMSSTVFMGSVPRFSRTCPIEQYKSSSPTSCWSDGCLNVSSSCMRTRTEGRALRRELGFALPWFCSLT